MKNLKTISLKENDKLDVIYEINPAVSVTVVCKGDKLIVPPLIDDLSILEGTNKLQVLILEENDKLEINVENNPTEKITITPNCI